MALELLQNLLQNQNWFNELMKNNLDVVHVSITIERKEDNFEYTVWTKDKPMFAFSVDFQGNRGHTTECIRCPNCGLITPLVDMKKLDILVFECECCKTVFGDIHYDDLVECLAKPIQPKDFDHTIVPFYFNVFSIKGMAPEVWHGRFRPGTNEYWIKSRLGSEELDCASGVFDFSRIKGELTK